MSIETANNTRIIDIFLIPNAMMLHTTSNRCDPMTDHNILVRELGLGEEWMLAAGELSAKIWAVGDKDATNSNLSCHELDADLIERIGHILPEGVSVAPRFLNRMPVRMLLGVKEDEIVELIPGILSARMTQQPYRYGQGKFEEVLTNLIRTENN